MITSPIVRDNTPIKGLTFLPSEGKISLQDSPENSVKTNFIKDMKWDLSFDTS